MLRQGISRIKWNRLQGRKSTLVSGRRAYHYTANGELVSKPRKTETVELYHPVLGRYQSEIPKSQVASTHLLDDPNSVREKYPHLKLLPEETFPVKAQSSKTLVSLLRQNHAQELSVKKQEWVRDVGLGQVVLVRRKLCLSQSGENTSKTAQTQQILGVIVEIKNQFKDPLTCSIKVRQIILGTGVEITIPMYSPLIEDFQILKKPEQPVHGPNLLGTRVGPEELARFVNPIIFTEKGRAALLKQIAALKNHGTLPPGFKEITL